MLPSAGSAAALLPPTHAGIPKVLEAHPSAAWEMQAEVRQEVRMQSGPGVREDQASSNLTAIHCRMRLLCSLQLAALIHLIPFPSSQRAACK